MLTTFKKWLLRQEPPDLYTMNPDLASNIKRCVDNIDAICDLMPADDTSDNWRIHFEKIRHSLESMPNQHGLARAFQLWDSMQGGMGSWNDYYIPHPDQKMMSTLNETLQQNCASLQHQLHVSKQ